MTQLANKRIILGVCGSIAAYKAGELIRRLRDAGAEVRVVMTQGATEFVTPLTFQALSGYPVHQHLLDTESEAAMGHIQLARWADAILIAPASADFISRLALGRANDLLTALCLASDVPLAIAPAMNQKMWADPATQANVQKLTGRGVLMFGPEAGEQACGEVGEGRLLEPKLIIDAAADIFQTGSLTGKTVVITAGPTQEAIDPVRFISNYSSGKMGYALAEAAVEAGARVLLVSGPVKLNTPDHCERIDVISALEMMEAVEQQLALADIFISTAAVADYRPLEMAEHKIKKSQDEMTLTLKRNPDILASVKKQAPWIYCVGFAAETQDIKTSARAKLNKKQVDMIAANWVGPAAKDNEGTFDSDNNALQIFWPEGETSLPLASKHKLARELLALVSQQLDLMQQQGRMPERKTVSGEKVVQLNVRGNKGPKK